MDAMEKAPSEKRLIDANKLIKNGIRVSYGFDNDGKLLIPMGDVIRSIKEAPTIDAVPVRHGRWEGSSGDTCSVCGEECFDWLNTRAFLYQYCPNCGAKMDGGDD